MLFCVKVATQRLVPVPEVHGATPVIVGRPDAAVLPKIADSGKIRPGGGCRLPLQGAPMQRDRLPRVASRSAE